MLFRSKTKVVCPEINYLFIGSGELLETCKQTISKEALPVTCLGWIPQVEDALAITDLMLLTSENEGMPLSLIQAGMAGIPAISTNVGSVREVIVYHKSGYVLDFDANDFSQKIIEIYENTDLHTEFGRFAKEYTNSHFNVERLANDHKATYLNLIN